MKQRQKQRVTEVYINKLKFRKFMRLSKRIFQELKKDFLKARMKNKGINKWQNHFKTL